MFSGQKGIHSLNIFKWRWSSTSSLTTRLLNDESREIELSDYHNAPSLSSESPSGLLDGEILKVDPIDDLDLFFERVYTYHCDKGLWCIISKWIFELLSLAFTICFSGFFLLFVDWSGLRRAKCGMDAVESGIKPCDLSKEALLKHPFTPFTISKAIIIGYLGIFSIYWIFCFLRFFAQLRQTLKIRWFYYSSLGVTDKEIQTIPWSAVLEKIVGVQRLQQLCVVKDLSIHDIVMRLMRKENYLIGMINKGVLAFPISRWVPGGTTATVGPNCVQRCLVLPKTLEWTLNWCILQSMFDRNFHIRRDFISDPETLKKMLMIVGFALFLLSPFLVIFMLVYHFLRHAEQFYKNPSSAASRRWSNLSKWMFREFNEVDHLFRHRINSSITHASDYLKQFPSPILVTVAKFISFVSGGFAAVLIIIAFLEESLLEGHIFGRNLFWYTAVFGAITAISRAAITDELLVHDPHEAMSRLVQHTHYMPKRWRGKENTETVRVEVETLFQYTVMMLLEDMASIFLTPYLLLFVVPKRVDDLLQFIVDFTVDVEGVGHVCCFSLFDFKNHGNRKYGSPFNSPPNMRSSQGKMEKSFLSFQLEYPSWESNADGKQLLRNLKQFRDLKLQRCGPTAARTPSRMQQQYPSTSNDHNCFFPQESTFTSLGNVHPIDSTWLINNQMKNLPYIIDWYYTSQNHVRDDTSRHIPLQCRDNDEENPTDLWNPPNLTNHVAKYNDRWTNNMFEGSHRQDNSPSASTSLPLFQESVLRDNHESSHSVNHAQTHWWGRAQQPGPSQGASFLEPPTFFREAYRDSNDGFSERSAEEQELDGLSERSAKEQQLNWRISREMSRTFFMDGGDFDLPFVDAYRSRPESLVEDSDPADLC